MKESYLEEFQLEDKTKSKNNNDYSTKNKESIKESTKESIKELESNDNGVKYKESIRVKFSRIKTLTVKNLKITLREKQNYFWIFGYPIAFLVIFWLAFDNGSSSGQLNSFDYMGPGILVMGVLVAISNTSSLFTHDREMGMMKRLDSTPISRESTLISYLISMSIISIIQIIIMMILLPVFGVYISPKANVFAIFIGTFSLNFIAIGVGLIVGALSKTPGAAGGISWMFILPLQFLGGAFFPIPLSISKFIPSYYAMDAVRNIIIYGKSIFEVANDLWIVCIFAVIFIAIGILLFKRKAEI